MKDSHIIEKTQEDLELYKTIEWLYNNQHKGIAFQFAPQSVQNFILSNSTSLMYLEKTGGWLAISGIFTIDKNAVIAMNDTHRFLFKYKHHLFNQEDIEGLLIEGTPPNGFVVSIIEWTEENKTNLDIRPLYEYTCQEIKDFKVRTKSSIKKTSTSIIKVLDTYYAIDAYESTTNSDNLEAHRKWFSDPYEVTQHKKVTYSYSIIEHISI